MALDRQGAGLALLRIAIGVFFLFEGLSKIRWFTNTSILTGTLASWLQATAPGSLAHSYVISVAIPWEGWFARLVPLGELSCGFALILGIWTPLAAFIAFFMALNYQVASGALFHLSFMTSGYGLPVLGATLALALGGVRLPWSIR